MAAGTPQPAGGERQLPLQRIMVPVDFSGGSRKALQFAALLAQDYGARLVLVHVLSSPEGNGRTLRRREQELARLARQDVPGPVPVTTLVKPGEPLREIIHLAQTGLVDLLVVSTHARARFPDFCLGSAAEQIVRYAPCPVLVVREQGHDFLRERPPARGRPRERTRRRGPRTR